MRTFQSLILCMVSIALGSATALASSDPVSSTKRGLSLESVTLKASAGSSTALSAQVSAGDTLTIETSTEKFAKVSLSTGESGWLPSASIAPSIDHQGRACFEVGLEKGIEHGVYEDATIKGVGNPARGGKYNGDSLELQAKIGAAFEGKGEICPALRKPVALEPDEERSSEEFPEPPKRLSSGPAQRMVLRPGRIYSGSSEGEVNATLEAYCLDESKRGPDIADYFQFSSSATATIDERVEKALSLDTKDADRVQACVWVARDARLASWQGIAYSMYWESIAVDALPGLLGDMAPTYSEKPDEFEAALRRTIKTVRSELKARCPGLEGYISENFARADLASAVECFEKGDPGKCLPGIADRAKTEALWMPRTYRSLPRPKELSGDGLGS